MATTSRSLVWYSIFAMLLWLASQPTSSAALVRGASEVREFQTPFDYGDDRYNDVAVDEDGTCYTVGNTNGALEDDYSSTKSKLFVHRRSGDGTILWQRVLKDLVSDYYGLKIVSLDSSTLLIIYRRATGYYEHEDLISWVAKNDGTTLKTETIRNLGSYYGGAKIYEVMPDNQGSFLLLDMSSDRLTFYNASRHRAWQMNYPLDDYLSSRRQIAFAPDGDFSVVGSARVAGAGQLLPSIKRFSPAGAQRWQKFFPDEGANPFTGAICDHAGNTFAINNISRGSSIRKIAPDGMELWRQVIPYSGWSSSLLFVQGYLMAFGGIYDYSVLSPDGVFLGSGKTSLQISPSAFRVNPSGAAAAVGRRNGKALIETFSFLTAAQTQGTNSNAIPPGTLTRPYVSTNSSVDTRKVRVVLTGSAYDASGPDRLYFRIKKPNTKWSSWYFIALPGTDATETWRLPLRLAARGRWLVDVVASNGSGEFTPTKRIRINRR